MSRICWLASYMKSGNTWLRIFINNLRANSDDPVDINSLSRLEPIASSRMEFDDAMGVESSDLTFEEIEYYRPAVYRHMAHASPDMLLLKIHDAYTLSKQGIPIVPTDITHGAIYILRNPLDVAVSMSHFVKRDIDSVLDIMGCENLAFAALRQKLFIQLLQRTLSWSRHVTSWIDLPPFPVHVVRYEDMQQSPLATFTNVARFAGLPDDEERVARAIRHSSFGTLQQQEQKHGFRERPGTATSFFRKGEAGGWRRELTEAQVERIITDHGAVMRRFGYLSESGQILC